VKISEEYNIAKTKTHFLTMLALLAFSENLTAKATKDTKGRKSWPS
jgi:hypothetical protein